jgi:hypothetical protein
VTDRARRFRVDSLSDDPAVRPGSIAVDRAPSNPTVSLPPAGAARSGRADRAISQNWSNRAASRPEALNCVRAGFPGANSSRLALSPPGMLPFPQ